MDTQGGRYKKGGRRPGENKKKTFEKPSSKKTVFAFYILSQEGSKKEAFSTVEEPSTK